MAITAQTVRELREKTGAGMMDCKRALEEASGHPEKALEILRKQGLAAASKKESRVAAEGMACTYLSADGTCGVMVEVNCETDFVAKNDDFRKLGQDLTLLIASKNPPSVQELANLPLPAGLTVAEQVNLLVAKIGEKIEIRRFVRLTADNGEKIGSYVHLGSKIGVLVKIKGNQMTDQILKDVAMHVAAAHPHYLNRTDISADVVAHEKEIYRAQMNDSGKPVHILEKIVEGKIAKFATDVCLNDQIFIKDPTGKKTVSQILKEVDSSLQVTCFARYQVGEGIEKKKA